MRILSITIPISLLSWLLYCCVRQSHYYEKAAQHQKQRFPITKQHTVKVDYSYSHVICHHYRGHPSNHSIQDLKSRVSSLKRSPASSRGQLLVKRDSDYMMYNWYKCNGERLLKMIMDNDGPKTISQDLGEWRLYEEVGFSCKLSTESSTRCLI